MKFAKIIGLLITCALVVAGGARAQLPTLKKPAEAAAPEAVEKPEDARKRIEQWQKEARDALARMDASNGSAAAPPGITPAEIEERRRDLEQMVLVTTNALRDIEAADQARKALEKARAEDAAWTGFRETAPFSILLLDDLHNGRGAILARLRTHESALTTIENLRTSTIGELKAAEDAASIAMAAMQNAPAGQADPAKWRFEAARGKVRLLAARAGYLQSALETLKQRIATAKTELSLVDRKIGIVGPEAVFSDEDLAKVETVTKERNKTFTKEIAAISKRLQSAVSARDKAQSALDELLAEPAGERDPAVLELAAFRMETAEGRVESLQSVSEALEGLILLENMGYKAYQDRRTILTTKDENERAKTIGSLAALAERYRAWLNVLNNEMATCGADLSKIESRATTIPAGDPRFELLNEQRASRSEKLAMLQRVHQTVTSQRGILRRWIDGFTEEDEKTPLPERLANYAAKGWDMVKKTWALEVMSYEDKIEVDGETITGRIPVTLGMLLRALLFFVIGYAISARLAKRLQTDGGHARPHRRGPGQHAAQLGDDRGGCRAGAGDPVVSQDPAHRLRLLRRRAGHRSGLRHADAHQEFHQRHHRAGRAQDPRRRHGRCGRHHRHGRRDQHPLVGHAQPGRCGNDDPQLVVSRKPRHQLDALQLANAPQHPRGRGLRHATRAR